MDRRRPGGSRSRRCGCGEDREPGAEPGRHQREALFGYFAHRKALLNAMLDKWSTTAPGQSWTTSAPRAWMPVPAHSVPVNSPGPKISFSTSTCRARLGSARTRGDRTVGRCRRLPDGLRPCPDARAVPQSPRGRDPRLDRIHRHRDALRNHPYVGERRATARRDRLHHHSWQSPTGLVTHHGRCSVHGHRRPLSVWCGAGRVPLRRPRRDMDLGGGAGPRIPFASSCVRLRTAR